MTIRAYHLSRGDDQRKICLIPARSRNNPASAAMAGMKIIVTKTMENGNIDEDVRESAYIRPTVLFNDNLPLHTWCFESAIREITQIIHDNGGLVYMDGANMNASGIN
jgi:glycine dehydrogenase